MLPCRFLFSFYFRNFIHIEHNNNNNNNKSSSNKNGWHRVNSSSNSKKRRYFKTQRNSYKWKKQKQKKRKKLNPFQQYFDIIMRLKRMLKEIWTKWKAKNKIKNQSNDQFHLLTIAHRSWLNPIWILLLFGSCCHGKERINATIYKLYIYNIVLTI